MVHSFNSLTNLKQSSFIVLLFCAVALTAISQPAYGQISEFKILPSDGDSNDNFGISISISGDYAVVGAFRDDDNGNNSGSAYVFKRSGTSWAQEAKLLPSDGASGDYLGGSVSISGDYAVVGSSGDDDNGDFSGSAYVFKRTGTSWAQEAKLLPSDEAAGDEFGVSVSISGDHAVVGAKSDDDNDNGTDAGSAYLYTDFATAVGVESETAGLPAEFSLSQNYPNPFNPETVIEFTLPQSGDVSLIVYNLRGEEVTHLVNRHNARRESPSQLGCVKLGIRSLYLSFTGRRFCPYEEDGVVEVNNSPTDGQVEA